MAETGAPPAQARQRRSLRRWLKSTSRRTFVLYPAAVVLFELVVNRGRLAVVPWGVPFLAWGYLQYRWVGQYRSRLGGGGPGLDRPPERIVTEGPYGFVRNPMYLGHLIFMAGLALTFRSWLAAALLAFHVVWFDRRVRADEARLEHLFGDEYRAYSARVKRWIPGLV